ncbi:hypothetical protein LWI29_016324 [Acer saccharum]|uniref:RNase H type-1 domain-containing protein n=1 Tax=Acer saccharum TaxID=4024 RepID=A0AA39VZM7_ACESA|nr:hypothetical protein LWI29_016324 [Acer saccharum]
MKNLVDMLRIIGPGPPNRPDPLLGPDLHRTTYIDELVSSTDEVILLLLYTEVDESRTTYSLDMAHALANQFKKGKECLTVTNDFIRALKNGKNPYRNPLSQDIREGDYPFGTPLTHRLYYNEYGFDYNEDDHKDMVSACFIGEFVMTANPKVVALTVNNVRTLNARLQELKKLKLVHFLYDIRQFLKSSDGFDIKYMPRESNSFADSLAKAASSGGGDRLEWGDV